MKSALREEKERIKKFANATATSASNVDGDEQVISVKNLSYIVDFNPLRHSYRSLTEPITE